MPHSMTNREAVGVFTNYDELYETIKDLGASGFGRHQISVLGSDAAVEDVFHNERIVPEQIEDNPVAPRSFIVGAEELGVAQGVLIGTGFYIGAIVGILMSDGGATSSALLSILFATLCGGLIGAGLARLLGSQYKQFFQKRLDNGGLVLWVETPNVQMEKEAQVILMRHGAHDVHIHALPQAA